MNKNTILKFFVTGFGFGFIPLAPGTFGSLVAIGLYALTFDLWPFLQYLILVLYFFLSLTCLNLLKSFSPEVAADKKEYVCDEILALWLMYTFIHPHHWYEWVLIFILFRLFDILKPYPIDLIDEKLHNPMGVMMDDLLAAVYGVGSFYFLSLIYEMYGDKFI